MTEFTPWSATFGGALIGLAAVVLFRLNGRIVGISGIASNLISVTTDGKSWRLMFVLGLLMGPFVFAIFAGKLPDISIPASYPMIILAGLLVGFGTRLGSGCTSGHGICGLARLSLRSLVAVLVFMATAILSAGLVRLIAPL